jgi:fumarylacetoacetate (FAA) hydrolase
VRTIETIAAGKPRTPFLKDGDTVRIEMKDVAGRSIFGCIDQTVAQCAGQVAASPELLRWNAPRRVG